VLFGDPRRSFYANEVIGLARSGTGAVQRELARLEASGLVTATRVGKQKHYQANAGSPVFEELRFDLAYNAAHALCLGALRHSGYRARTDTSCFRYFRTRSASAPRCGGSWPDATTSAIAESTRAICTSTSAC
jgi:hypothetical protein